MKNNYEMMEFYSKPNLCTKISYFLNIEYSLSLQTEHQSYKPVLLMQIMPNTKSCEVELEAFIFSLRRVNMSDTCLTTPVFSLKPILSY